MIFLIDDNKNNKRANEFGVFFVEDGSYKSVLEPHSIVKKGSDLSFLQRADCILVHKTTEDCDATGTYIQNSHTVANDIIEKISDYGTNIPLVIFSNKMQNTEYSHIDNPNCIFQINKVLFYSRLYDFVAFFEKEKAIELRILAYGVNFAAAEADVLTNQLLNELISYLPDIAFKPSFIRPQLLESYYRYTGFSENYIEFFKDLEKSNITVRQFRENISIINESINLYGRNICNWTK